nr:hypothetical protein [Tanacetum cinerariifolium]
MAHMLKCRPGKLPFMYLGLPIGVNMNKAGSWGIIVEKFKDTLSEWKAKSISFGGRLTLVQSVLGGLSLYYFSLFRAPTSVINTLEREKKISFGASNLGLLRKWWWRFREDREALWVRVIESLEIDRTGVVFSSSFGRKLGNGDGLRGMKMSRLGIMVNGVVMGGSGNGNSSRWFLASDGVFSVKHIRELIDEKILRAVTYVEETSWCKFVPRKVNVFIWRLKCGWIPIRSILDHIGIDLDSTLCPCCENAVETIDHIMVRCPLVPAVWSNIFLWWGIGCFNGSSLSDILPSHGLVSSKLGSVWQAVGVPRGRSLSELEELSSVLRDLAPVLGYVDSSRWFLASDGVFSVKHIRELIDEKIFGRSLMLKKRLGVNLRNLVFAGWIGAKARVFRDLSREIDRTGVVFSSSFGRKLGNGDGIRFWKDEWARDFKLCVGVPRGRSLSELEELSSVLRDLAPVLGESCDELRRLSELLEGDPCGWMRVKVKVGSDEVSGTKDWLCRSRGSLDLLEPLECVWGLDPDLENHAMN